MAEPLAGNPTVRIDPAVAFRILTANFDTNTVADGSAFFVSADGLAVTCAHVVEDATPLAAVLRDGRQLNVDVVSSRGTPVRPSGRPAI